MAEYNPNFELTIDDIDLIESALRQTKEAYSQQHIELSEEDGAPSVEAIQLDETMKQIQDLLGRIHNQKVFFRPREEVYIGG